MIKPSALVETARGWIGAPVAHQGSRKDTGCDCLGLLRGVGAELELFPEDFWSLPGAARWKAYGREPIGDFCEALEVVFDRVDEPEVGGVAAMRFLGYPRHCAVIGDYQHGGFTLIHALHKNVIEHRLDERWMKRCVAFYRFRGVSYER